MCGICGSTRDPGAKWVARMNAAMTHRGPDDEGIYRDEAVGVALGARRLSVIDVEGGHQPVGNEDGTVWAALNGEIYNHPALREHLLERGHVLRSGTDTEVLVHLYEEYGDALVHSLEGMFAFALWDARRRQLLIVRDRFGEKPLFYHEADGVLTFASELTALLAGSAIPRDLDLESLDSYFVFGYVPGPESIVRGIRQLPPAHALVWEPGQACEIRRYWQTPDVSVKPTESLRQLTDETGRLLRRSIGSRLIADVPLGVLLSGGIDSSLIAVLAAEVSSRPIKTFTVGYDVGGVAETEGARITAREIGSDHHELVLEETDLAKRAPRVLADLDQPLADQALVATHAIAEFCRREVTVAVGGEGADELFGGYPRYRWLRRAARLDAVPDRMRRSAASLAAAMPARGRLERLVPVLEPQPTIERHIDWVTSHRRQLRRDLYGPALVGTFEAHRVAERLHAEADESFGRGAPDAAMRLDQRHWLPDDVLAKADRASMQNSLELRTPYLHHELAEFAASVPESIHTAAGGKQLLRKLAQDLGLSASARAKTAFRVPAADWLRGPLAQVVDEQLRSGVLYEHEILNRDYVARLVSEHRDRTADWTQALWPVLALGLWADRFFASDAD